MSLKAAVCLISILLMYMLGCNNPTESDYLQTVQDGISSIPTAGDLDKLFPQTEHFITHYNMRGTQWFNSVVYLNGGYILTIQNVIDIDYSQNKLSAVSDSNFYLSIVSDIERLPDGRLRTSYVEPDVEVTDELWIRFVESGGDITLLGFDPNRENPKHWNDYVAAWQADRISSKNPPGKK